VQRTTTGSGSRPLSVPSTTFVLHDIEDRGDPAEREGGDRTMSVLTTDLTHTLGSQAASTDWFDTSTPCRSYDAELWFAERPDDVALAQALCGGCALRAACLAGALERREPWGVWGGELFERGSVVARKRRPGRPRKDDHLDRRAAEDALAQRMAELASELATADHRGHLDDELADVCAIPAQRGGAAA
jgi:WhiB family redox-sensing transcriptional regulator